MLSSEDRRRAVRRWTNVELVTTDWHTRACRTFGSPWLELVVRAGRANAIAGAAAGETHRELIAQANERVWALSELAQDRHRRSAALRDIRHAEMLRTAHARITSLVEELEQSALEFHRARVSDDLERSMSDLDDLALRLKASVEAMSEIESL